MTRALVAAAAGALLAAAFPMPSVSLLAWIAVAPLMVLALSASGPLRAGAEGLVFGLAFHGLTFSWWYGLLRAFGGLSVVEAAGVFLLLTGYLAAYAALFGAGLAALRRRRSAAAALLLAPALWAALEMIRGRAFTGLPWSVLGASQQPWPACIQVADLGGVTLVSFVVAAGNALAAWAFLAWRGGALRDGLRRWAPLAALLAAVPVLALAYGAVRLARPLPASPTVRVGLVQGNVPQEIKWAPSERRRILRAHLDATREAASRGATLVVWPESSVPLPLTSNETYRTMLEELSERLGIDLVVGSVHYVPGPDGPEAVYNSAFLLSGSRGGEIVDRYDKRHLVPFGEYVPLRSWLGPVEKMVEEASDFSSGRKTAVFDTGTARLGPFICFEAIFPGLVRQIAAAGAQILVNLTNDAFLGDTAGPRQHLELAAMRAVENRRWMVRAANTGISAVIDPLGRVTQALPYGTAGVLVADVPLLEVRSFYTRVGDAAGWTCVLVCVLALIFPFSPRNPLRKGRDRA